MTDDRLLLSEQSKCFLLRLSYEEARALDRLIGRSPAGTNPELYDLWQRIMDALEEASTKADVAGTRI